MKQKLAAEFLGTFMLVFIGTGAVVVETLTGKISSFGAGYIFALILIALIYGLGHFSGGHFNPAVTVALLYQGTVNLKEAAYYILVQLVGALLASVFIRMIFGNVASLGATLPTGQWSQAFIMEVIVTFIFIFILLGATTGKKALKNFAGIAVGLALGLGVILCAPISGGSLNPARSLAPAVVSGNLSHFWIYLIAPTLGAIIASMVYKLLFVKMD